jgi:hypothetical protein
MEFAGSSAGARGNFRETRVDAKESPAERVIAPAAIERALYIYQQLQERDRAVVLQARKILTQHIYGMIDQGEHDEQRLTVGGLIHLKAVERDPGMARRRNKSRSPAG